MKISLNTIKSFGVDVNISVDELVRKIGAQLGEVEGVTDLADKYKDVVIAKVVEALPHPDADKLRVCLLDDGQKVPAVQRNSDGLVQVVCGAPNMRAGLLVAWLPPGATVPSTFGTQEPFVLEVRELRGQISNGMVASQKELGLGDDHRGILEIKLPATPLSPKLAGQNPWGGAPTDRGGQESYLPGDSFAAKFGLNDVIIEIENKMFTRRPDCFGQLGVAREIAGILGQQFDSPARYTYQPAAANPGDQQLKVAVECPDFVPRLMAQLVEGVQVGPSPPSLRYRLQAIGIKPINNIVDVTNLIMHHTGQPLHAYDYDKLKALAGGTPPTLAARLSQAGEKLEALGGKVIAFDQPAVVIAAGETPVGLAGIIGGANTEVDENTKNIVLECGNFDMYSIRRSCMHYGLFTEAGNRFNKGQSLWQNSAVLKIAAAEVVFASGGQTSQTICDSGAPEYSRPPIVTSAGFINARLGSNLTAAEVAAMLQNVELSVSVSGDGLQIDLPFWRMDLHIAEDIVEEVGRLYGYDHLPLELPKRSAASTARDQLLTTKSDIRQVLARAGANEVLTYSFVPGKLLEASQQDLSNSFAITNALSPELQYYRQTVVPSLLDKVHQNIRAGYDQFALFEIAKVHQKSEIAEDGLPREQENLGLVLAQKQTEGPAVFYQARAILDYLAGHFGVQLIYRPFSDGDSHSVYDPARSVWVACGQQVLGVLGELLPSVEQALKLPRQTAAFEVDIAQLISLQTYLNYQKLLEYPAVEQALTLQVAASERHADLAACLDEQLRKSGLWYRLQPASIYCPGQDVRNHSFTIRLASTEKTLTTHQANAVLDNLVAAAVTKFTAVRI